MRNKYLAIIIIILAAILIPEIRLGMFAFILLVITTFLIYRLIDNGCYAFIVALIALNYLNSIFTIIVYYVNPSESITILNAALLVFSYASITGLVDLFIEVWVSSQAIGFHIAVVSVISVLGILGTVVYFKSRIY